MTPGATVTQRELATLLAYLETGSHKKAAQRMGISESTCRKRVARLMETIDARNVTQAVWRLRAELAELEAGSRLA
jgi:DNA-binding NarL/FixJ family response regulator